MLDFISLNTFIIALFLGLLALAALSDAGTYRIPNRISALIAALYPVYVLAGNASGGPAVDVIPALTIAATVLTIGIVLFALRVMGGGDVKLLAAVSLWAGSAHTLDFLFITAIIGGLMALVMATPLRYSIALTFDAAGHGEVREKLLSNVIPYGIAIAGGGWFVGARLLAG